MKNTRNSTINYTALNAHYWEAEYGNLEKYIDSDSEHYLKVLKKVDDFLASSGSSETDSIKYLQNSPLWEELWLATYKQASRIVNASWNHATRTSYLNYASSSDAISEITMHLMDPKRLITLLNCRTASKTVNTGKDPSGRLSFSSVAATNKFKDMNEKAVRKQTPPLPRSEETLEKTKTKYRAANPLINLDELANPESHFYNASALTDSSINILEDLINNETSSFYMRCLCRNTNAVSFFLFTCRHYLGYDTNKLLSILQSNNRAQLFAVFGNYCSSILHCNYNLNVLDSYDWEKLTADKIYRRVDQVMSVAKNYTVHLNTVFATAELKDFFLYVAVEVLGYNKREIITALNSDQKNSLIEEFKTYCSFAIDRNVNVTELLAYNWETLTTASVRVGISHVEDLLKALRK